MYCTNCGTKNKDNAKFCVECGEKFENNNLRIKTAVTEPAIYKSEKKTEGSLKKSFKKIKIVPIVILLLLVVTVIVFPKFIIAGQTEKKIIKEFVKAEMTGDVEKIIDNLPEEILEIAKTEGGMSRDELAEAMRKQFDSAIDTLESTYGKDWKYSYKINSLKKVSQEDLEDIKDMYSDDFEIELDISEAKSAEVEINISGNQIENNITLDVSLIKAGGTWYLDIASLASLL